MGRIILATAAMLLFAAASSAYEATVFESDWPIHLGEQRMEHWDAPDPITLKLDGSFELNGPYRRVWVDLMEYGIDFYYSADITVNNLPSTHLCMGGFSWTPCNITIDPKYLRLGLNSFSISTHQIPPTYVWDDNYDDFMLKKIKINVEYVEEGPRVIATKTQSAYVCRVGEPVNVTITLSNVGSGLAFNVSAHDVKLTQTYLISGSPEGFFTPLRGGDVYRYRYTIIPSEPGEYKSFAGRFEYNSYDHTQYSSQIEPTRILVKPPPPQVYMLREVSSDSVTIKSPVQVRITLVNNATENAYNVSAGDFLPANLSVSEWLPNASFKVIRGGENVTFNYSVVSKTDGNFIIAGTVEYADSEGNLYRSQSNDFKMTSVKVPSQLVAEYPLLVLALIIIAVIALSVVYLKMKAD
jgi:uncharacterized repeat protein (TIGR01451 family)